MNVTSPHVFVVALLLTAVATAAEAEAPVSCVRLATTGGETVPRHVLGAAILEASALWAVYGVHVSPQHDVDRPLGCSVLEKTISVSFRAPKERRPGDDLLGEIRFDHAGPTIVLYYSAIARVAGTADVFGLHAGNWPLPLRDQLIGRALGRVLAHELGHLLLRSRCHSTVGMMRPTYAAARLVDSGRDGFALTPVEVGRLPPLAAGGTTELQGGPCDAVAPRVK